METIIASSLNFAVVVFILWFYGRKPVAEMFTQRSQSIETQMREAEEESKKADEALAKWDTNWKACEAHATQHEQESVQGMSRLREKVLANARTETDRIKAESKLVAQGEVLKIKKRLTHELAESSIYSAERFLQKQLDERDRHKLVSDYVELISNGKTG